MKLDYNIAELFAETFGLNVGNGYEPKVGNGRPNDPKGVYGGIQLTDDLEEATRLSSLGTPVLFPITFVAGSYKKWDDFGKIETVEMAEFTLPYSCVIDFNRPKIIAKTNMSNGTGSVKEIFGFDDWQMTIRGFFLPQPNHPQGLVSPYDQETQMNEWDSLACSIGVENKLMLNREIKSLTIEDFRVNGERGKPNVRPFTISASSDEPVEIQISKQ